MRNHLAGLSNTALVAAMILAGLGAGMAHGQGLLIAEVRVEGAGYVSADIVLDAVKDVLKPGTELTKEKATEAEKNIMRLGYYDRVTISQRVIAEGRIRVIITVVERQRIEKILFVGNTVLSDDKLLGVIKSKPGGLVDRRLVERDAARIQEAYTKAGYFAQVTHADVDNFGVLTFVIQEARIEAIKVSGLRKTEEWVVRRQVNLKIGELFRDRRVTENIRRISDLQIFETVESDIQQGVLDPMSVIVEFKIKEGRTGQAQLALAYSSLDDLVMMISVQENNFRGEAERATVSLELFGRTSYDLSYVEPYWDSKDTSLEFSLFDTERHRRFVGGAAISTADDQFEERRTGGSVRVSRPLDTEKRQRASIRFRTEEVSSSFFQGVRAVEPLSASAVHSAYTPWWSRNRREEAVDNPDLYPDVPEPGDMLGPVIVAAPLHPGGRLTSLTLGYTNDLRDSRLDPHRGAFTSLSAELAGSFLGGEADFRKLQGEYRRYVPVRGRQDVVAFRFLGGTSFGDLPLFESFSVGGANTLRGYEEDRYRGESIVLGSAEYRYRLNETFTLVGFVDVGDAFGGEFATTVPGFSVPAEDDSFSAHVGVGAGMRVVTPIGPLRLDFGWGEDGSETHFSFGHVF